MKLRYNTPRTSWLDGLPIGNGRLAAMVWGKMDRDIVSLNNEWLWTGITKDRTCDDVSEFLPKLREFIEKERLFEATAMANLFWGGKGGSSPLPGTIDEYQPAGDIIFKYDDAVLSCRCELDILNGIAENRRTNNESSIKSDFFVSSTDNVLVSSWESCEPFSGHISYDREEDERAEVKCEYSEKGINVYVNFLGGISFELQSEVDTDGEIIADKKGITIKNATHIAMFTDVTTENSKGDGKRFTRSDLLFMKENHMKKFSSVMDRCELRLDDDEPPEETDKAVCDAKNGKVTNGLLKLYFDYGRYLFVSASICAELPLNLQGKWNREVRPPWGSDYHLNINIQMCYWSAEMLCMGELVKPFIDYVKRLSIDGKDASKKLYGCRGIFIPHATDAWAKAIPDAYGWAVWVSAAGWLGRHLWQHYEYSGDEEYLLNTAYPYLKDVAEFYEDFLVCDDNGIYQIMPSQSPENRFKGTGKFPVSICKSSAMDVQIAYDSLNYAIDAACILNVDAERVKLWKKLRDNLPPFAIGKDGRLLEWDKEREETEPGHRHISHLYGVYPSDIFNSENNAEQFDAARKSLDERLSHGGGHTGWSRAWTGCFFAKFGDGDGFYENYAGLIKDFATESLLDLHPPRIFQIDGNIGGVAAMLEAIVSVSGGKVHLLHALPKTFKSGSLKGINLPGGHVINIFWENNTVTSFDVTIGYKDSVTIVANGKEFVCRKSEKIIL